MEILKTPEFENDDYLIRLNAKKIPTGGLAFSLLNKFSPSLASYYETKRRAFFERDVRPNVFSQFVNDRPSLRSLSELPELKSTIYTVACERQNALEYHLLIDGVKRHLEKFPNTRRCVVRLANSFVEYSDSEMFEPADVTCLNLIHYFKDSPRLVFRASDIENELLIDILTITEFFIKPVYGDRDVVLSIYASTSQNQRSWSSFVDAYERLTENKT